MRPIYESREHLLEEQEFASAISKSTGRSFIKTPKLYPFDYFILRESKKYGNRAALTAIGEVKVRRITFGQYPDIILSLRKFKKCNEFAWHVSSWPMDLCPNIKFIFFVKFLDRTAYVDLTWNPYVGDVPWIVSLGGRSDRGDSSDIEKVIHIPMERFVIL